MRELTLTELERLQAEAIHVDGRLRMDEDAFTAFYGRTSPALWRYLARLTGDRQQADDLLQECYYRFLRAASEYENEEHRRRALFRIATNLARDRYRRQLVRPRLVGDAEVALDQQPAPAEPHADRTDLRRAMLKMRARDRAMLWLAYGEGASHQEIAEVVGVKSGSVKLLLFRARRRLASLLGGRVTEEGR